MNIERYDYAVSEMLLDYDEFESDGPQGKINDLAISDNKDTEKILATVAATVLEFTQHFPDIMVYATGSTPARTRLYQMGISANWAEIESILKIFGFNSGQWQPFQQNINYEAFLAIRKKIYLCI